MNIETKVEQEKYSTEDKVEIYKSILQESLLPTNAEIDKIPRLNKEEQIEFAKKIEEGEEEYKGYFLIANLKMVRGISTRFFQRNKTKITNGEEKFHNFEQEDLFQEGIIGLIKSIDTFDYKRSDNFASYAYFLINNKIRYALKSKGYIVGLPHPFHNKLNRFVNEYERIITELGYIPSSQEIGQKLNLKQKDVDLLLSDLQDNVIPLDDIKDEQAIDPEEEGLERAQAKEIRDVLDKLSQREKEILYQKFGFETGIPKTPSEMFDEFGITRSQIESALNRVRIRYGYKLKPPSFYFD